MPSVSSFEAGAERVMDEMVHVCAEDQVTEEQENKHAVRVKSDACLVECHEQRILGSDVLTGRIIYGFE